MPPKIPPAFLPRAAAAAIERAARIAPVVVLLGARQTGKTTLLRELPLLQGRPYLTLDDFDLRAQAEAEPEAVVARAASRITIPDAKGLEAFLEEYPDLADGALLLYGGDEIFPLTSRVLAAPWWKVI